MEPFPCRSLSKHGVQHISLYRHVWRPSFGCVKTVTFVYNLQLHVVIFPHLPHVDPINMEPWTSYGRHVSMDTRPTGLVGTLLYVLIPVSILTILSLSGFIMYQVWLNRWKMKSQIHVI